MPLFTNIYQKRRFVLIVCLTLGAFIAGYVWGDLIGYRRGKADTLHYIEERLNQPAEPITKPLGT